MTCRSRKRCCFWLLCWLLSLPAAANVQELIDAGVAARLAGDSATAIERFDAVLQQDPGNADVHLQLALAWRMRGQLQRSADYIERGLELAPHHGDLRVERARLALWDGREAVAADELDAVLAAEADHAEALNLRVQVALRRGDMELAQRHLSRLLELEPDVPSVRLLAADAAWLMGQGDTARDETLVAWLHADGDRTWLEPCCDRMRRYRRTALEVAAGGSRFQRLPVSDWREQRVQVSRRGAGRDDYWLRVQRLERFDARDHEFTLGASRVWSDAAWGWLELGGTPQADFRPDWQLALGGEWAPRGGVDAVGRPTWTGRLTLAEYDTGTVASATAGLRYWWTERTALGGSINLTRDEEADYDPGWQVRIDHRFAAGLRAYLGYADVADTVRGRTVSTRTWFGGLAVCLSPRLELFVDLNRDDRQGSYLREAISGGVRLRW